MKSFNCIVMIIQGTTLRVSWKGLIQSYKHTQTQDNHVTNRLINENTNIMRSIG
jgi:hypothetical protein